MITLKLLLILLYVFFMVFNFFFCIPLLQYVEIDFICHIRSLNQISNADLKNTWLDVHMQFMNAVESAMEKICKD